MTNHTTTNDEELLALSKLGDNDAFIALYNRYKTPMLLHACKKLNNLEDAEDILHDLFLNVWKRKSEIRHNIKSYLYTALRNKIIDFQIKSNNAETVLNDLKRFSLHNNAAYETDYTARENVFIKQIDNTLNDLSATQKAILKMRMAGYKNIEIAAELKLSEKTVRNHTWSVLKKLRSRITILFFSLF